MPVLFKIKIDFSIFNKLKHIGKIILFKSRNKKLIKTKDETEEIRKESNKRKGK